MLCCSLVFTFLHQDTQAQTHILLVQIRSSHLVVNAPNKNAIGDDSAVAGQAVSMHIWG